MALSKSCQDTRLKDKRSKAKTRTTDRKSSIQVAYWPIRLKRSFILQRKTRSVVILCVACGRMTRKVENIKLNKSARIILCLAKRFPTFIQGDVLEQSVQKSNKFERQNLIWKFWFEPKCSASIGNRICKKKISLFLKKTTFACNWNQN